MHSFSAAATTQAMALNNSDFYGHPPYPFYTRVEEGGGSCFADLGELEQSVETGFQEDYAFNLSRVFTGMKAGNLIPVPSSVQSGILNYSLVSAEMLSPGVRVRDGNGSLGYGPFENWVESGVIAEIGQQTDTSTDTDDKNQCRTGAPHEGLPLVDSMHQTKGKDGDQKTLRRLAQNREAARKSRMRKKAYVQELENSRQKLSLLEQELNSARQQGPLLGAGVSGDVFQSKAGNAGDPAFDACYARWLDEHQHMITGLRTALNSLAGESKLRVLVDGIVSHYNELFLLKRNAVKSNVFHMFSGMWMTPAERYFMWLGGFRCSDVLKILGNQIEPLTEQQLVGICNLKQSSQQAEDALSQGMEALNQSLFETLSSNSFTVRSSENMAAYMAQMTIAMSKLSSLENFLYQADLLRQQILQQLQRLLTSHQAARALLAISDYRERLRALSSLWLARPKD